MWLRAYLDGCTQHPTGSHRFQVQKDNERGYYCHCEQQRSYIAVEANITEGEILVPPKKSYPVATNFMGSSRPVARNFICDDEHKPEWQPEPDSAEYYNDRNCNRMMQQSLPEHIADVNLAENIAHALGHPDVTDEIFDLQLDAAVVEFVSIGGFQSKLIRFKDQKLDGACTTFTIEDSLTKEQTGLAEWKKRLGLDPQKGCVFQVFGPSWDKLPMIREAFFERGWKENTDIRSSFWDIKFGEGRAYFSHKFCPFPLEPTQAVNYHRNNVAYTVKAQLCQNLRKFGNKLGTDAQNALGQDTFFPRCYDLTCQEEVAAFTAEFQVNHALCFLRIFVQAYENIKVFEMSEFSDKFSSAALDAALQVCRQMLVAMRESSESKITFDTALFGFEFAEISLLHRWLQAALTGTHEVPEPYVEMATRANSVSYYRRFVNDARKVLKEFRDANSQSALYGDRNLWICKPAALSRGRGVFVTNCLEEVLSRVKDGEQRVVQKCIENPLVIENHKFDIRQWVLVTSWNPLRIWFYNQAYLRFCFDPYDIDELEFNPYAHLANHAVSKKSGKYNNKTKHHTMWDSEDFADYLEMRQSSNENNSPQTPATGKNTEASWKTIQMQMKQIAYSTFKACQKSLLDERKGAFELLGFDFMVDEELQVWLIEVNSTPDLQFTTATTRKLVRRMMKDLVKVVVDVEDFGSVKCESKPGMDSGGWVLLQPSDLGFIENESDAVGNSFESPAMEAPDS